MNACSARWTAWTPPQLGQRARTPTRLPWIPGKTIVLLIQGSFSSTSEEKSPLFLCGAALYCTSLHRISPYCPVLPHVTPC